MKKMMHVVLVTVFFASLIACTSGPATPSESVIQTAIAETMAANPTSTIIPTDTPTFTPTLTFTSTPTETPTLRPTNTATSTLTPTPTQTDTPTPLPPATQTALAVIAKKTETSLKTTATSEAIKLARTATADAKAAIATKMAEYAKLPSEELQSYAEQHKGEKVVVHGRVINIVNNKEFQMFYSGTYDGVYVKTKDTFSGLYEYHLVTVYGVVAGEYCFLNVYGAETCQPLIEDAWFVRR